MLRLRTDPAGMLRLYRSNPVHRIGFEHFEHGKLVMVVTDKCGENLRESMHEAKNYFYCFLFISIFLFLYLFLFLFFSLVLIIYFSVIRSGIVVSANSTFCSDFIYYFIVTIGTFIVNI